MANASTSPMDATGLAAEKAAKSRAKELAERQDEIALVRQAEAVSMSNDVFDPKQPDKPIVLDEVENVGVSVKGDDFVIIRTMHDIEEMTFGIVKGIPQNYSFQAGKKYRVPLAVARHLNRLGYTWNV